MISKYYRFLGIYDKLYNKWFMSGQKKAWVDKVKSEDKSKYKIAIIMIQEVLLEDYDDVDLTDICYDMKYICRIFDGNDIITVKGTYKQRSVYIIILYLGFDLCHYTGESSQVKIIIL